MFKKVQYTRPSNIDPDTLVITKTGRINLNRHYVKRCSLDRNVGANLYWDEASNEIALTFTKKGDPGSFPLVFIPNGQAAYIVAAQFFRSHGLDLQKYAASYKFEAKPSHGLGIEENGEVFIINLKEPKLDVAA